MRRFIAFAFVCALGFVAGMTVRSVSAGSPLGGDPFIVNRAQQWISSAYAQDEDGFPRFYAVYFGLNDLGANILIEGRHEQQNATNDYERAEARMKVELGRVLIASSNQVTFP